MMLKVHSKAVKCVANFQSGFAILLLFQVMVIELIRGQESLREVSVLDRVCFT